MTDNVTIIRNRQLAIRREMDRRGISLKQVQFDSGLPYPTLLSYFPAEGSRDPAVMPVSALYSLVGALPVDLLSLLLPGGFLIVRAPEAIDHDQIADAMVDYLAEKQRAHRPDSECGPAIGPSEDSLLTTKLTIVAANAA